VYNHEGNQRFREILRENLEKYKSATTKQQKTTVVNALLEEIKEESRFVRKLDDGKWVEVAEHVAKEKVSRISMPLFNLVTNIMLISLDRLLPSGKDRARVSTHIFGFK
jgi:uncharacterized protein YaaW (UPF0174 family)